MHTDGNVIAGESCMGDMGIREALGNSGYCLGVMGCREAMLSCEA